MPKIEDLEAETLKVETKQPSALRITEARTRLRIRPKRWICEGNQKCGEFGPCPNTTFFLRGAELIGTICKVDRCFFWVFSMKREELQRKKECREEGKGKERIED